MRSSTAVCVSARNARKRRHELAFSPARPRGRAVPVTLTRVRLPVADDGGAYARGDLLLYPLGVEGRSMTEGTTSPDAVPETLHSQQRQSINRDFRTGMLITSVLTIGALGIEQSSRGVELRRWLYE